MSPKPRLFLIDGSSQMYRAFHAPIRTAEGTFLRNASGIPTNAVYIFVTMLRKLLKEQAPAYIAASFDLPGRTFRDDLAADYKALAEYRPTHKVRFVTAASLFDGHDAAINIMPSSPMLITPPLSLVYPPIAARMRGVENRMVRMSRLSIGRHLSIADGRGNQDQHAEDHGGDSFWNSVDLQGGPTFAQNAEQEA